MKIYFTCSTAEYNKYRENYHTIRNYLVSQGHVLTRDWLREVDERLASGATELQDIKQIYRACMEAIREAELVIIEDTVSNFSTGHQITVALRQHKPTLVLWQGKKYREFSRMFIHGIESDILQIAEYDNESLENIIKIFIEKFTGRGEDSRFNLVLDGTERNYLDWVRFNSGKSRTKAIRDALQKALDTDEDYKKYLAGRV